MNALEVKIHLFKKGLTISAIAREIELEYEATFDSLRMMLSDMFYHGKYNAKLAKLVKAKFQITVDKPSRPQTVREAVQRAA